MSSTRILLGIPLMLLGVILPHFASGLFLWPRLVPYYYPLPDSSMSSSASSSLPSALHGNQNMYDWNTYNQHYPHSPSVLFPSSGSSGGGSSAEQTSTMSGGVSGGTLHPSIGHTGHGHFSGFSRWFQKPWLSWKLAKFGLRSPSASSPCSSSLPIPSSIGSSSLSSTLFPSLSSASLTSPSASPPPCATKVFTCCNAQSGGGPHSGRYSLPAPTNFVQTHVTYDPHAPTYHDRRISSSGHHYPNNYISYSSGSNALPASSMETETVSQVSSDPMSISYDFISRR